MLNLEKVEGPKPLARFVKLEDGSLAEHPKGLLYWTTWKSAYTDDVTKSSIYGFSDDPSWRWGGLKPLKKACGLRKLLEIKLQRNGIDYESISNLTISDILNFVPKEEYRSQIAGFEIRKEKIRTGWIRLNFIGGIYPRETYSYTAIFYTQQPHKID